MASRRGRGRRQCDNVKEETPTDSILQDVVRRVGASPIANPSSDHSNPTILTGKGSRKGDTGQDDVDRNSGPVSARMEEKPCTSPDESDPHQVCVVCGDKASGQYFGAIVCLPCKSFYIRCTKDGDPFFSTRCLGNCDVTKQARIRCQSCRFQKCLNAGMSRREKPERVDPEEGQYLCLVCGDLANGIHFGVFTCEGCKKFFRRGLVENKTYNCKGDSSCVINPRSRNTCRACRYRKCIEVGMSREAIKMGRPKKKDGDNPRRAKTSTSRPSLSTDETLDVILVHSNESDSDEDVKLLEVPVDISDQAQHTPEENKLLPSTEHSQSVSSSHISVQSPSLSAQGSPGKSWSPYPVQQMTKSTKETQPFKSIPLDDSPHSPPSTVTSGSEYHSYEDRRLSARTAEKYGGTLGPEKSLISEVNETALLPVSTESLVTSNRTSSTDSEISAIYSMSSEEIDSMLRLLEDFEKPKMSSSCRRRTSRDAIEDDNQGKRKRLADETVDKCRGVVSGVRYCSHYEEAEGPHHSEYHSSMKQGIQTAWNRPMKIESSDSKGRDGSALHAEYSTTTYDITPGDITKATRVIQTSSVDSYVSHTGLPMIHPNTSCPQSGKVTSDENDRRCNCRCWTKQPNTVKIQTSENWKESRGSFNEWTSKGSNSTSTSMKSYNMKVLDQQLDRPSFGEISKAFEVLYDKLGYSNAMDEFCTVEKRKQSISSVESWWDIDVDCRCIKVTGGLCLCQGPNGQMTDEAPEEKYLATVPPPIARICTTVVREPCSPYLPRKYRSQEFLEPSSITDVQQQVLHQLLESCLMSIADTNEGAGKEENCTTTEIPTLLRA